MGSRRSCVVGSCSGEGVGFCREVRRGPTYSPGLAWEGKRGGGLCGVDKLAKGG